MDEIHGAAPKIRRSVTSTGLHWEHLDDQAVIADAAEPVGPDANIRAALNHLAASACELPPEPDRVFHATGYVKPDDQG